MTTRRAPSRRQLWEDNRPLGACQHCKSSLAMSRYQNCVKCKKPIHSNMRCIKCNVFPRPLPEGA